MVYFIKKGLDVPIQGKAKNEIDCVPITKEVGLDLSSFSSYVFKPLIKVGDPIKLGEGIAHDLHDRKKQFLSPATGKIKSIDYGKRRRISMITIESCVEDDSFRFPKIKEPLSKELIIDHLLQFGLFPYIQKRPLCEMIDPKRLPDAIFISAVESAPFIPDASHEYLGNEAVFQHAVDILQQIAPVYIVYEEICFANISNANLYQIKGKHPKANVSVHIEKIKPIKSIDDCIWTLKTEGVVAIGKAFKEQKMLTRKNIAIAGEGIHQDKRKIYNVHIGSSIAELLKGKLIDHNFRVISGDPLTGKADLAFLGFYHKAISTIQNPSKGKVLHFLRYGKSAYTFSNGYGSAFSRIKNTLFSFTTSYNGEERPFVDGAIYDRVFPMKIPVEALIKAILAKDFDEAVKLGLLEIAPEDFALPEFICPSKIPFMSIVEGALEEYKKVLS